MFRQGRRLLISGVSDVATALSKASAEAQVADRLLSGKLASSSTPSLGSSVNAAAADTAFLRSLLRAYSSSARSALARPQVSGLKQVC